MPRALFAGVALLTLAPLAPAQPTPAEASGFRDTARHAEVIAYGEALAKRSPLVKATTFGTSQDGRPLPLWVLGEPPAEPGKAGKPVVLVFANIHAGEVDGKDALLALARDLVAGPDVLKKVTVLLVPDLNPDGNEQIDTKHRPEQAGPAGGVGVRENAQGFDLNRDFVKLESPEIRALVKLVNQWNPVVVVDCHTTNGSYHRYTLTYDGPRHPAADPRLIELGQGKMLPDLAARVKNATGFDTHPYGNFADNHTKWETYPAQPRFGVQYLALRGAVGLLSESYTYASFADRVKASYAFVHAALGYAADHADELKQLAADASKPRPRVALRSKAVAESAASTVLGYVEEGRKKTDSPKDYSVKLVTRVEPTLEVDVPAAYVVPPGFPAVVEALQRHGIKFEELTEDLAADAQLYPVTEVRRAARPFQKHALVTVEVAPAKTDKVMLPAGGALVRTAQPLGSLAAFLLEPQAEDGLATWNFFDSALAAGRPFPVLRLPTVPAVQTAAPAPLPDDKPKKKPITLDMLLGGGGRGGGGGRFGGGDTDWLPDGEHFLQTRQGGLMKVNARTGEAKPFLDAAKFRASLGTLKDLSPETVDQLVRSPGRMNKDRTGALVTVGGDAAVAYFDGTPAVRVTKSPGRKEYLTLGPDGKRVAFVRNGNLFAADVATQTEVQLTTDGGGEVQNAVADWVYEEEIFNRANRGAYWWSPDGTHLAFLRFDDTPVKKFPIAAAFPTYPRLESESYPKTGDPNPTVKIGVAPAAGGKVTFLDLTGYPPASTVISRVGWVAGTGTPFAYVQNRQQTWLDFVTWPDPAGKPKVLFRDTTKAWVEDLGEPKWLKDGSFLVHSERSGWKHLYHYAADGRLIRPVTTGEWEAQTVERVDEAGGWVYVTGNKDNPTGTHLYRAKLDGTGEVERLTEKGGTHRATIAPAGGLFVDRFSDDDAPQQSAVFEVGKGKVRTLDAAPARGDRDQYAYGKYERVQVPMADGFVLEGALVYPPDFDPKKVYPVWVMTYAGPHAPTVRTGYSTRMMEQYLATCGIVVFRVDPRSASGKGAQSAWACYKQLGVQELKDLEAAVAWLCKNPWADPKRVGLSGHSYGGYMTAYALTHSKTFSAGIAGAPVTDWRLYDTIYTERYMGLPSENKAGYDKSSVVRAAANLHGKLLLIHGMIDDNVHLQNSAQFIDALQRANKDFEVMVYPQSRHGIGGPHYTRLQVNFIRRTMGVEEKK